MNNKGIVIWLALITAYIGFTEISLFAFQETANSNLEMRKDKFENIDERFKNLDKYLNETLNENINERFKTLETYLNEEVYNRFEYIEKFLHEH